MIQVKPLSDAAFRKYGRVIEGLELAELLAAMNDTPAPDGVVYEPSVPSLEKLAIHETLRDEVYGGMPIQIGYCNGANHMLNAVEYHRDSEIDICATDLILLIGMQQDIDPENYTYDTAKMEAFLAPAGTAVELYATTLHYAPISDSREGKFRCVIVLPKGTNENLPFTPRTEGESRLLFAVNKWLIAHADSGLGEQKAHVGLRGENITI